MKERPILFSGPMVRAILDGHKTQTRRVIKDALGPVSGMFWDHAGWKPIVENGAIISWEYVNGAAMSTTYAPLPKCPYGKPGDQLWVRETFTCSGDDIWSSSAIYAATPDWGNRMVHKKSTDLPTWWREGKKMPSIFMPRWASRITLEVIAIRAERLQAVTELDTVAEGVPVITDPACPPAAIRFQALWNSINAERGYPWASNPWVWVVEFKRVQP